MCLRESTFFFKIKNKLHERFSLSLNSCLHTLSVGDLFHLKMSERINSTPYIFTICECYPRSISLEGKSSAWYSFDFCWFMTLFKITKSSTRMKIHKNDKWICSVGSCMKNWKHKKCRKLRTLFVLDRIVVATASSCYFAK